MPPEWPRGPAWCSKRQDANLEGPSRSARDGRSSAEVAQLQRYQYQIDVAVSSEQAQIALFAEARAGITE